MYDYNEINSFNMLELGMVCSLLNTKRRKLNHNKTFNNEEIKKLQYRLLLTHHCMSCNCNCQNKNCKKMKKVLDHISLCCDINCKVEYCLSTRYIINHFYYCNDKTCKICVPIKKFIENN